MNTVANLIIASELGNLTTVNPHERFKYLVAKAWAKSYANLTHKLSLAFMTLLYLLVINTIDTSQAMQKPKTHRIFPSCHCEAQWIYYLCKSAEAIF